MDTDTLRRANVLVAAINRVQHNRNQIEPPPPSLAEMTIQVKNFPDEFGIRIGQHDVAPETFERVKALILADFDKQLAEHKPALEAL